jgi:CHAT domain
VNSESTVKLVKGTLNKMSANRSLGRAEALRRSMLALIEKGELYEAHPTYWAPFVVMVEGGSANVGVSPPGARRNAVSKSTRENPKDWATEFLKPRGGAP